MTGLDEGGGDARCTGGEEGWPPSRGVRAEAGLPLCGVCRCHKVGGWGLGRTEMNLSVLTSFRLGLMDELKGSIGVREQKICLSRVAGGQGGCHQERESRFPGSANSCGWQARLLGEGGVLLEHLEGCVGVVGSGRWGRAFSLWDAAGVGQAGAGVSWPPGGRRTA